MRQKVSSPSWATCRQYPSLSSSWFWTALPANPQDLRHLAAGLYSQSQLAPRWAIRWAVGMIASGAAVSTGRTRHSCSMSRRLFNSIIELLMSVMKLKVLYVISIASDNWVVISMMQLLHTVNVCSLKTRLVKLFLCSRYSLAAPGFLN